jgi:hypothetical protein
MCLMGLRLVYFTKGFKQDLKVDMKSEGVKSHEMLSCKLINNLNAAGRIANWC